MTDQAAAAQPPLVVPGYGLRDAISRTADTWPRHRARARQRRLYYVGAKRQRQLRRAQQARRVRSYRSAAEA